MSGESRFKLNTSVFNISGLTSHFDIEFVGTPNGPDRIRWRPELPPPGYADITTSAGKARVVKVEGELETEQSAVVPPRSGECEGELQAITATMKTIPGVASRLKAHASAEALGGVGVYVTLTNLVMDARCSDPVSIGINIRKHPHSNCVFDAVEGTVANLFAKVSGVPSGTPSRVEWSVTGGTASSSTTGTSFRAGMPSASVPVVVTAVLTVSLPDDQGGTVEVTVSDTYDVHVISGDLARTLQFFCEIAHEMRPNLFVDPLWDPLRELIRRPLTKAQVLELRHFSGQLDTLTRGLLEHTSRR